MLLVHPSRAGYVTLAATGPSQYFDRCHTVQRGRPLARDYSSAAVVIVGAVFVCLSVTSQTSAGGLIWAPICHGLAGVVGCRGCGGLFGSGPVSDGTLEGPERWPG